MMAIATLNDTFTFSVEVRLEFTQDILRTFQYIRKDLYTDRYLVSTSNGLIMIKVNLELNSITQESLEGQPEILLRKDILDVIQVNKEQYLV